MGLYKTVPPSSATRSSDSYSHLAPSNSVRTEQKSNSNGSVWLSHFDENGKRIGSTTVGKDGTILRSARTNEDGTRTVVNYKAGIERTYSAPGQPASVITKNHLTGETRSSYVDSSTGERRNYVSRNGVPYSYQTAPNHVAGTNTVIYDYRPGYNYSSHDDFWFYMWLTQSMNHHQGGGSYPGSYSTNYSSGGGGYFPSSGSSSAPTPSANVTPIVRDFPYDWATGPFKNLPADLAAKKTYTDPADFVTDHVVFGMISSIRSAADEKRKDMDSKKCGWFSKMFGCENPEPEYTDAYLKKLEAYNLDYNTRALLNQHVMEILENIHQSKPVSVKEVLTDSSPEAKSQRLYVFQEDVDLKDEVTLDGCSLSEGDVVRLKAWYPGTEKVSVEVVKLVEPDEESCKEGSRASMNISDLQDLESDFAHRVELATIESKKLLKDVRH